ncbi:hypothetical protein BJ912DRAFT_1144603 [Pholiota molesta]|nr:hypothetical protein BJ912DRAFT_1144603 [Pholiota molesta]
MSVPGGTWPSNLNLVTGAYEDILQVENQDTMNPAAFSGIIEPSIDPYYSTTTWLMPAEALDLHSLSSSSHPPTTFSQPHHGSSSSRHEGDSRSARSTHSSKSPKPTLAQFKNTPLHPILRGAKPRFLARSYAMGLFFDEDEDNAPPLRCAEEAFTQECIHTKKPQLSSDFDSRTIGVLIVSYLALARSDLKNLARVKVVESYGLSDANMQIQYDQLEAHKRPSTIAGLRSLKIKILLSTPKDRASRCYTGAPGDNGFYNNLCCYDLLAEFLFGENTKSCYGFARPFAHYFRHRFSVELVALGFLMILHSLREWETGFFVDKKLLAESKLRKKFEEVLTNLRAGPSIDKQCLNWFQKACTQYSVNTPVDTSSNAYGSQGAAPSSHSASAPTVFHDPLSRMNVENFQDLAHTGASSTTSLTTPWQTQYGQEGFGAAYGVEQSEDY